MVPGFLETVRFNFSLIFESWVGIQGRGGVGLVVLNVANEYIEWKANRKHKG